MAENNTAVADPVEGVATALGEMAATVRALRDGAAEERREFLETIRALRPAPETGDGETEAEIAARAAGRGRPPMTAGPLDRAVDPWTAQWTREFLDHQDAAVRRQRREDRDAQRRNVRANFEMALMIADGYGRIPKGSAIRFSDEFMAAARYYIHEDHATERLRVLRTAEEADKHARAMDTQETGYGLELVGAQYVSEMWAAARNLDSIVPSIREIPMNAPTGYVPIDGNVPEMLFVEESTTAGASAYTSSKTPSNRVTLTAKKFTIQQRWSGEMEEDSIIAYVPFLRDKLAMSAALHLGSAYYNGDTTNAGTGNINLDDANPADTKHYLAWDGIRHFWLVDYTGQGVNMAAALDFAKLNVIRGRLNGGDDDVDNALTNINWGLNPRDLRIVADWDTYMAMLDGDKVTTIDKYGSGATALTGELGSFAGVPIITPPYATKTEADGKASTTEASNTKGQISMFAPAGWLAGSRRNVQMFMDRVQGTDQILIELYTRRALTKFGTNVAAGIYNISL